MNTCAHHPTIELTDDAIRGMVCRTCDAESGAYLDAVLAKGWPYIALAGLALTLWAAFG